jgi:hypothetical protein
MSASLDDIRHEVHSLSHKIDLLCALVDKLCRDQDRIVDALRAHNIKIAIADNGE